MSSFPEGEVKCKFPTASRPFWVDAGEVVDMEIIET